MKVTDGSDATVLTFGYDARGYRITKGVYAAGMLSQTRHYYHSDENQVLEERVNASSDPDRQYTWGDRYIDDLVLRTRDTDSNGSLDETLYALHDANWSVTALADTSGTVVERFRYDAYGRPAVLDANFANDANGLSDYLWEYRFTSREWNTESGLHYFRARYYDDAGGRFLQRDPIGYVDGMNLYGAFFIPFLVDPNGTFIAAVGVLAPGLAIPGVNVIIGVAIAIVAAAILARVALCGACFASCMQSRSSWLKDCALLNGPASRLGWGGELLKCGARKHSSSACLEEGWYRVATILSMICPALLIHQMTMTALLQYDQTLSIQAVVGNLQNHCQYKSEHCGCFVSCICHRNIVIVRSFERRRSPHTRAGSSFK